MKTKVCVVLWLAMFCGPGAAMAQPNLPSPWNPTPMEMVKLPQYCWAQFNAEYKAQGIPTPDDLCPGAGMNHLCPGLVQLNRAATATYDRQFRRRVAGQARVELDYTLKRLRPGCRIAQEVHAADGRLKALELLLK